MRMHNPPHPGASIKTLCLEPLNSEQTSGMSVILPTAEYRAAQQMVMQDGPEGFNILLRQAHERQAEWTWASADVLGGALD